MFSPYSTSSVPLILHLLRSNCGIIETDTPEEITEKVCMVRAAGWNPDQGTANFFFTYWGSLAATTYRAGCGPKRSNRRLRDFPSAQRSRGVRRQPLILVLEDLHWVDTLSAELAGFLAESIADARILILATYRPGFIPPWIDKSYRDSSRCNR